MKEFNVIYLDLKLINKIQISDWLSKNYMKMKTFELILLLLLFLINFFWLSYEQNARGYLLFIIIKILIKWKNDKLRYLIVEKYWFLLKQNFFFFFSISNLIQQKLNAVGDLSLLHLHLCIFIKIMIIINHGIFYIIFMK